MKDQPSQWTRTGLSCREVTDRASEYLDDRLLSLTKIQVVLHLVSCAHCRAYVKQIDLISAALRSLPTLSPSTVNRLRLRRRFAARHGSPT
jgi:anti-sigma factor RsiW